MPSMLLQTLIENAVKHGVSQAREPGRIEVIVRTHDGSDHGRGAQYRSRAREAHAPARAKAKVSACTACASA